MPRESLHERGEKLHYLHILLAVWGVIFYTGYIFPHRHLSYLAANYKLQENSWRSNPKTAYYDIQRKGEGLRSNPLSSLKWKAVKLLEIKCIAKMQRPRHQPKVQRPRPKRKTKQANKALHSPSFKHHLRLFPWSTSSLDHHKVVRSVWKTPTGQPRQSSDFYSTEEILDRNVTDPPRHIHWILSFVLHGNSIGGERGNALAITHVHR